MSARVLVTAENVPDLDGVACSEVYAWILQQRNPGSIYEAAYGEGVHIEAAFVCQELGITPTIIQSAHTYNQFVLVDMSELVGAVPGVRGEDVISCIDHRLFSDYASMPNADFRIEQVGAAATIIAETAHFSGLLLSPEHAALLLCAIYSNTVNFKADVTMFRDYRAREWLERLAGERYANLPARMFEYKSSYALAHLKEVLACDAKSSKQLSLGLVGFFQIETTQAAQLMEMSDELCAQMRLLFPDHLHHLLIVQDIQAGATRLLATTPAVLDALANTNLQIQRTDRSLMAQLPGIVMRKSILNALYQK